MVLLKNECKLSSGSIISGGNTQTLLVVKRNLNFMHSQVAGGAFLVRPWDPPMPWITIDKSNQDFLSRSGGSKGGRSRRAPPPYSPNFSHFHAVFGKIWQNRMLAPPSPRVGAPSYGEYWIRPCFLLENGNDVEY